MSVFTYHLIKLTYFQTLKSLIVPIELQNIEGLIHAEKMTAMVLGSPILSKSRFYSNEIVIFAQWKNEEYFNKFIKYHSLGKICLQGWYTQLKLIKQWGCISGYHIPKLDEEIYNENQPIVAITLARMKYTEIYRFLNWGRPVEKLVRDHPATSLSLASIRYPNTISTFSIWKTQKDMEDMVKGHSQVSQPKRHLDAMKERERKNFHYEFTTLRFIAISEFGSWKGISNLIPENINHS